MTTSHSSISILIALSPHGISLENVGLTLFMSLFPCLSSTALHSFLIAMQITRLVVVTVDLPPKRGKTQPLNTTKQILRKNTANTDHMYSFAVRHDVLEKLN
jgi:hypothetical protein